METLIVIGVIGLFLLSVVLLLQLLGTDKQIEAIYQEKQALLDRVHALEHARNEEHAFNELLTGFVAQRDQLREHENGLSR